MVADMIRHVDDCANSDEDEGWTHQLFSTWYFHDPWVKAAHNVFHSPITLSVMLGVAYCSTKTQHSRAGGNPSTWCFWMLCACFFHTFCDIPVHHDDGPLILFPINWEYRFHSPLSYYDPNYHGREFALCEHIVDGIIILAECYRRCYNCSRSRYQAVDIGTDLSQTVQYRDDNDKSDVELTTFVDEA